MTVSFIMHEAERKKVNLPASVIQLKVFGHAI